VTISNTKSQAKVAVRFIPSPRRLRKEVTTTMYDMLPFPSVTGKTPEEQVAELTNYLIQFKETLEFILGNISVENLSQELIQKLNDLGADVVKNSEERDEQLSQIANKSLTVSDVINSEGFKASIQSEISKIKFTVNMETGNLEYRKEN
jgi:hypothetical protein